jgi:hypothetical protein
LEKKTVVVEVFFLSWIDDLWSQCPVVFSAGMACHWQNQKSKYACHAWQWSSQREESSKGKSSGKGKQPKQSPVYTPEIIEPPIEDIAQQVQAVLPEAALIRQQPLLDPAEWSAHVCHWQQLSTQGGIAICPKARVPNVLRTVNWTQAPTAIPTSENPDALGLSGFPRTQVWCNMAVMAEGAERKTVQVRRWMTQLGYGQPVLQKHFGPTVQLYSTMKEMVVKFHPMHDWPEQKLPVGIIFEELSKIVSEHALSDIQPRESMSASFLCHADYIDKLLRSSGRRGIFIKEKKDSGPPLELLWLGEEQTFQGALDMAEKAATSLGIAQKGPPSATRYALRFRSHDALMKFAKEVGLEETAALGRFKLSGVHTGVGTHGVLAFLIEQKWSDVEVIYVSSDHAIFLAGGIGEYGPMNYMFQGALRQLRFTALNSQAKSMIKSKSQVSQQSGMASTDSTASRAASRKQFFTNLVSVTHKPLEFSSPAKKPDKRTAEGQTGQTPGPKTQREA